MQRPEPQILEWAMKDIEAVLRRVEAGESTAEDRRKLWTLSKSYIELIGLLKDKNTSIGRLRKMLFGATTETTENVLGEQDDDAAVRLAYDLLQEAGAREAGP